MELQWIINKCQNKAKQYSPVINLYQVPVKYCLILQTSFNHHFIKHPEFYEDRYKSSSVNNYIYVTTMKCYYYDNIISNS